MMAIMLGLGIVMSCKIYKDVPVNWFKPKMIKIYLNKCLYKS
jgi:hypothetical protein